MSHMPRITLTVDLTALAGNYAMLARQAGGAEVAPVVKADAYGLGAAQVAERLWAEGAKSFFVARLEEGEALRAALGPARQAAIYVLDGALSGGGMRLKAANLIPVLNSPSQVEEYGSGPAALHIDTGMNRLGFRLEEIEALLTSPDRLGRIEVGLVISHLACAGEPEARMNAQQVGHFRRARALFPQARASLANSAGTFLGQDFAFDMVRPGITLYGGGPFETPDGHVAPVVTVTAPILQVRAVNTGESIGYGAAYTAEYPRRIAIVGMGYADGILRTSSPTGSVWFAGALRPLLGRVSMDLIAIDVTGVDEARPGAMVEIIGPNRLLDEAAADAGTIAYEVLARLGARAERVYV